MIVFAENISEKHKQRLKERFPNRTFVFSKSEEDAIQYAEEAEVYITYARTSNQTFFEKAKNLKWVHVMSAGFEELSLDILKEKNILLTNVRGIHAIQMSEYAISMLLQVYRQGKVIIKNEENRVWDRSNRLNEITGKTMVVVGAGAIGSEVARLGKAFRMHTIGVSRSGREAEYFDEVHKVTELNHVLGKADFVISILPSTNETKDLYTYEEFQAMPNHAVFLNMGRGDAVVEEDLLKAIQENQIAHAVLDVVREEPLPADHPFWFEENITITPHVSGVSPNYVSRALEILVENLSVYEQGSQDFINQIDLNKGY